MRGQPYVDGGSKPRPQEIWEQNANGAISQRAIEEGVSLSAYLEELDPSEDYDREHTLDAFGRQLRAANIHTSSDPVLGVYADRFSVFDEEGNRPLALEWMRRRYMEARTGRPANPRAKVSVNKVMGRDVYTSQDDVLGTIFAPWFDSNTPREHRVAPPLALSRIVAQTTGISGDAYRAAYLQDPATDELREKRVTELGEIPLTTIAFGENEIRLHKYGIGFEVSYEAMRRAQIDKVAFWVQRKAIQNEADKTEAALDVLINGDGNANAATTHNLTTLDSGTTANNPTYRAWLQFKEEFGDAYRMDLCVVRSADKVDLFLLDTGTGNHMALMMTELGLGGMVEGNGRYGDQVEIASYSVAPASSWMGIDTSAALEWVIETGSQISETTKFVTRQSDVVVMTEVEGFAVLDANATHIADLTA